MPSLQLPNDHCQTAADVRAQAAHASRMRSSSRMTLKDKRGRSMRSVRVDSKWTRTDKLPAEPMRRTEHARDTGFVDRNKDPVVFRIMEAIKTAFVCGEEDIFLGPKTLTSAPRHAMMYLLYTMLCESFGQIGRRFGVGHATASYAVERVSELLRMDPGHPICVRVRLIQAQLGAS